jgi:hypothetical protein
MELGVRVVENLRAHLATLAVERAALVAGKPEAAMVAQEVQSGAPVVRKIWRSAEEQRLYEASDSASLAAQPMLCAYHVENAFPAVVLAKFEELRQRMPLDLTRPTCPRRFLSEWDEEDSESAIRQHHEDGWVGRHIDEGLRQWQLGEYASQPWFRFLEYSEGGAMAVHTDGSCCHPVTGDRSEATMLVYLSTCDTGGETALFKKLDKKEKREQKKLGLGDQPPPLIEAVRPAWNTALIFPHNWQHEGCPVLAQPKIALRCQVGRSCQVGVGGGRPPASGF